MNYAPYDSVSIYWSISVNSYVRQIGYASPCRSLFHIYNKAARTLNLYFQFSSLFRTSPYHLIRSAFGQHGKITGGRLNGFLNLSQSEFSPTSTAKERNIPTSGTPSNSQINNRQTKERLGEAVTELNSNIQSKESELQIKKKPAAAG